MERTYDRKEGGIVMSWQQPKTDWTALDLFNIEDYNRIKGNLEYLHEKAQKLYREFSAEDMGEEKADYSAYFYADEFNAFESNLDTINKNVFAQEIGEKQTFFDNGPFIDWEELNRIESASLIIYRMLNRQEPALRRLSFRLGNLKGVSV